VDSSRNGALRGLLGMSNLNSKISEKLLNPKLEPDLAFISIVSSAA
jgi:hypothetical protein